MRYAIVTGTSYGDRLAEAVGRFLPDNYRVVGMIAPGCVGIEGTDKAGWTLNGYVRPRLASGLLWVTETDPGFTH